MKSNSVARNTYAKNLCRSCFAVDRPHPEQKIRATDLVSADNLSSGTATFSGLSTSGLSTGTYNLLYTVQGDPITHALTFQVR